MLPRLFRFSSVRCRALVAAGAAISTVALSACGSSSPPASTTTTTVKLTGFAALPANQILSTGCGATLPVASVATFSTFTKPALVAGLSSMQWVMTTAADKGILQYKISKTSSFTVSVVVVPNVTYVKAPASWWATTPASGSAAALANKWISISSSSQSAAIAAPLISYGNLKTTLSNCIPVPASTTKGALEQIGKIQTIDVIATTGTTVQLFAVPTFTVPYIAKVVTQSPELGQEATLLSGFNSQKQIVVPTGAVPIESPGAPLS